MLERLTPHRRNLVLLALGLVVLWFSWTVRAVLNPLLLGYLLAYIVHPLVLNLERAGWKRRTAVNAIFAGAGLLTLVMGLVLFLQGRDLALRLAESDVFFVAERRLNKAAQGAADWMAGWMEEEQATGKDAQRSGADPGGGDGRTTGSQGGDPEGSGPEAPGIEEPTEGEPTEGEATQDARPRDGSGEGEEPTWGAVASEFWSTLTAEQETRSAAGRVALEGTSRVWRMLSAWFGSLLAFGTLVVLLPVYTYFLLFELGRIHAFVQHYLPVRDRERLSRVAGDLGGVLANFFRGRLLVCFFKGAFLALGLALLGIDYWLLIGMGSGFLALVPFVGPTLGFFGALLIGLLDSEPIGLVVRLGVVFFLAEMIEGYVLLPKILGDSLGLHPVVVLASMMIGGAALGIFGVVIALPLTAALVILAKEFVLPALEDFAQEGGGPERDGNEGARAGARAGAGATGTGAGSASS